MGLITGTPIETDYYTILSDEPLALGPTFVPTKQSRSLAAWVTTSLQCLNIQHIEMSR